MPWKSEPDIWAMAGAIIISIVSGLISIAGRIAKGHPFSVVWFTAEILSAILAGYLMYDAYPVLAQSLPQWATMPIMVSLAAHTGGKGFQLLEKLFHQRMGLPPDLPPPDKPLA